MASTFAFFVLAAFAVSLGVVEGQARYFPDIQNVYHLFSRNNQFVSQPMVLGNSNLIAPNFDPTKLTGVLIHGWNTGPTSAFVNTMVPGQYTHGDLKMPVDERVSFQIALEQFDTSVLTGLDVNVIVVDWSAGAAEQDYNTLISTNVVACAESIARFINWLNSETGGDVYLYHIVGLEVGSHLAGLVGRNLNGQVYYVTALNPPRKGWNETNMFLPTDGSYTEAIHTDIFGTGMWEPVADVDFYPNGGLTQPGCSTFDWECSLDRSYQYFAESIAAGGGFTASRCETQEDAMTGNCDSTDTLPMAGPSNKTGHTGLYYLTTNAQSPFSQG